MRFRLAHLTAIGAVSLAWVVLALILWASGEDVAHLAAVVALFSVAMYGVAGGYKSVPILVVLVLPPLLALFGILTSFAWSTLEAGPALLTTFATFASCVTVGFAAAALHRSDEGLEKANAELRALTQRLTLLAERERVASQAKDVFLANVSHEIRTPLHGIIGLAATIDPAQLGSHDRESIAVIRRSGEMLERLISDLLDVAAIEAGRVQLKPEPVDPVALVQSTLRLMEAEAERKGLSLGLKAPLDDPGLLWADGVRLQQVVLNLLSNAVKYTQSGGVMVDLGLEPTIDDGAVRLRIAVSDTGEGFDLASHEKLFDRFERGDRSGSEPGGSLGLGLAITHALVGAMGGQIGVTSRIGAGSTFEVALPLRRAALGEAGDHNAADAAVPLHLLEGRKAPLRVLLVEDHPVNRRVITAVLEPLAVRIEVCLHGREAVEAAVRTRFDVILMDLLMPVMDGLEATRAIRRHEEAHALAPAAIIMLTASALPSQAEKAREAGCNAHLVKPVTPARLYETLGQVLQA